MASALPPEPSVRDVARAARVLWVRSRRPATGLLAGDYASAFRGGGMEFHESRPYVPGDDVRSIDWNATARTGQPWVKRFREERSQTLLLALDTSASMRFGSRGRSKAAAAAHAGALMAAAAGRAGDRIGLVTCGEGLGEEVRPGRGEAHSWRVIRAAVSAASAGRGRMHLETVVAWAEACAGRHAVIVVLSDWRDAWLEEDTRPAVRARGRLAALARRHDVVAAILEDPLERTLPASGTLRLVDPERPTRRLLLATTPRRRARYAAAARTRRRTLSRSLRSLGVEPLWLDTSVDPLRPLTRFFAERAARARRTS